MNIYKSIVSRTPIEKGWSGARKYRIVTVDGGTYLLRLSGLGRLERKKREFEKMK